MEAGQFKYWGFISYSHADEAWAGWLHRALEGYRVPRRLHGRECPFGTIPPKLFPVFRDRDELAGSSALGPELQKALQRSRNLVVICSPRAAQSRWVNEEIKYFKSLGRSARVFALIVDGEPHALEKGDPELECFPEALRFHVNEAGTIVGGQPVEPIAADVRPHGDGKANAKLKLISGILALGFDDLKQRELQARNRRLAIAASTASGVAALTLVLAVLAYQARDDAQRRQRQAEDLIQFMLGDLRKNLEPIGKLDILDAVGDKAMEYFATLDEQDVTDPVLQSRATALRQIGQVRRAQGDIAAASDAFREALELDRELVARHPDDAQSLLNVAKSEFYVGYAHYAKGELEQALPWFERQLATLQRLVALDPETVEWRVELGDANANLGAVAEHRGEHDRARSFFEAARESQQAAIDRAPDNRDFILKLAILHGWLTHVESQRRDHARALEQARVQAGLLRRLTELAPDNAEYRYQLASALHQLVYVGSSMRPVDPAAPELVEAQRLTAGLFELDPTNVKYTRAHGVTLAYVEDALVTAGALPRAQRINAEALAVARDHYRRAPESSEARDDLLATVIRSAQLARLRNDAPRATAALQEGERLVVERPAGTQRALQLRMLAMEAATDAAERARHARDAGALVEQAVAAKVTLAPEVLMRYHALRGDAAEAARWAAQLTEVERAHPYVTRFCRQHRCAAPAAEPVRTRAGAG